MASVKEGKWGQVHGNPPKKTGVDLFSGKNAVLVQLSVDEERRAAEIAAIQAIKDRDFVIFQAYLYQAQEVIWAMCEGPQSDMQPFVDRAMATGFARWINLATGY